MKKQILFIALALLLTSCLKRGSTCYEYGIVIAKEYTGERHSTGIGFGVSSSGNPVTVVTSSSEDERFNVVFKSFLGNTFSVNNDTIYSKVNENDTVIIKYFEMVNKHGIVRKLKFCDANKYVKGQLF